MFIGHNLSNYFHFIAHYQKNSRKISVLRLLCMRTTQLLQVSRVWKSEKKETDPAYKE